MRVSTPSLFFLLPALVRSQILPTTSPPPPPTTSPTPQQPPLGSGWIPISTFPITSSPTPTASPEAISPHAELKLRQGAGVAAAGGAVAAPNPAQQPTVTTYQQLTTLNGVATSVNVVYTQTFASVPDQGPGAMVGSIGMGTLTGSVGVVKSDEAKSGAGRAGVDVGMGRKWGRVGAAVLMGLVAGVAVVVV